MAWKDFLKPTKSKIIIFVIVLALSIGFFISTLSCFPVYTLSYNPTTYFHDVPSNPSICLFGQSTLQALLSFLFWGLGITIIVLQISPAMEVHYQFQEILNFLFRILVLILGIVVNLLWFYLLSCLIVWLAKKFRKK